MYYSLLNGSVSDSFPVLDMLRGHLIAKPRVTEKATFYHQKLIRTGIQTQAGFKQGLKILEIRVSYYLTSGKG
jgi:hypothetical protein